MIRSLSVVLAALIAFSVAPVAEGQNRPSGMAYAPPAGVEMEINLYPITRFRGNSRRFRASEPMINTPMMVESVYLVRGIWLLCSEQNYYGRCVQVSGSQQAINPPFPVRSVRLIGDSGPTFVEAPTSRAGPDVPMAIERAVIDEGRAPASPVVAPTVEEGGVLGDNPSLAGRALEFFPAPAEGGRRVLACSQAPGPSPNPRCVQASADGFCKAEGYRDSGWREVEVITGRAYLVNVLCKQAEDSEGARDNRGIGIPFFGN